MAPDFQGREFIFYLFTTQIFSVQQDFDCGKNFNEVLDRLIEPNEPLILHALQKNGSIFANFVVKVDRNIQFISFLSSGQANL